MFIKNFNIVRNSHYSLNFVGPSFGELRFYPDDWCGYDGICPLIEADINEEAINLQKSIENPGIVYGIFNYNLSVNICLFSCKYFRRLDIPKLAIKEKTINELKIGVNIPET